MNKKRVKGTAIKVLLFMVLIFGAFTVISSAVSGSTYDYLIKNLQQDLKNDRYDTLLKFADYYMYDPIYRNQENDTQETELVDIIPSVDKYGNEDLVTYTIFISKIDEEDYSKSRLETDSKASFIIICGDYIYDESLDFSAYKTQNVLTYGFNTKSEIYENCVDTGITNISLINARGDAFLNQDMSVALNYTAEYIETNGVEGYTSNELSLIDYPKGTTSIVVLELLKYAIFVGILVLVYTLVKKRVFDRK